MADEDDLKESDFWLTQSSQIAAQVEAAKDFADIRRGYYDVAFPPPEKVRARIPLITRFLHERHIARVLRAKIHFRALGMLHENGHVDWEELAEDYVDLYLQYLPSIKGKGREELRDTARFTQPQAKRRGLSGLLRP